MTLLWDKWFRECVQLDVLCDKSCPNDLNEFCYGCVMCILRRYISACLKFNHHLPSRLLLCCCYVLFRWEYVASLAHCWQERYVVYH